MSDCPYRVPCTSIGPDNSEARQKKALPSSFLPLSLGSGGLEPLIVLCFGDALFNELRFPRFCGLGCDKGEDSHEQE